MAAGIKPEDVGSAMTAANEKRAKWVKVTARGDITFKDLVAMTRLSEHKALEKIRLLNLLEARPGWSSATALEALRHAGFDSKDNILSIRKNPSKVDNFAAILERAEPGQWRPRPKMPEGWPWSGKMSVLAKACGVDMDERLETMAPAEGNVDMESGELMESESSSRRRQRPVEMNDDELDRFFDE